MAHILVIGAGRGIGRETARAAFAAGHRVRAMARDVSRLDIAHDALEAVAGDATDPEAVAAALAGVDAVVQALGIRLTPRTMVGPVDIFSRATEVLVRAMEAHGPRRLVAVTAIGTGDSQTALSTPEVLARDFVMGAIFRDKALQETIIRNSSLDWTLVRPTFLTNGPRTGRYLAMTDPASWRQGMISRADVADFIVAQIGSDAYLRHGPILAY